MGVFLKRDDGSVTPHFIVSGNLNMIHPVFVPLESLEAEEDNEPPSLEKRQDLIACPWLGMDSPSFGLTSKPKFIRHNSYYSGTEIR